MRCISEPAQPQRNKHMTVASRSWSPEDARWSLLRVDISDGWECDAHFFLSPRVHLASLSGRNIVLSIADLTVCEFYWTGRAGRISCFLLYRGSARVCRRHDSLIFFFLIRRLNMVDLEQNQNPGCCEHSLIPALKQQACLFNVSDCPTLSNFHCCKLEQKWDCLCISEMCAFFPIFFNYQVECRYCFIFLVLNRVGG